MAGMADRCTNRRHCLGRSPPVRRDRRLPRYGCMTCTEYADGACLYRERFGCADEDRAVGLDVGFCPFEHSFREEIGEPMRAMLAILPEPDREEALLCLELLLDALVYSHRSGIWMTMAGDAARYDIDDEDYFRAVDRYRTAGSTAVSRRYSDLRSFVDRAKELLERSSAA